MRLLAATLLLSLPCAAAAGGGIVEGTVAVTAKGAPVADASDVVVYVVGFTEPAPAAKATLQQEGERFVPTVLPITVGQTVEFPNEDMVEHNVFAPNPADERPLFDLGQYGGGKSKSRRFDKPGAIDVYCNIHPSMAATVLVLPNRRFARTDAAGRFRLEGVPPGAWEVFAFDRAATTPARAKVTVAEGGATSVQLALARTRTSFAHKKKTGEDYGPKDYENERKAKKP